MLYEVDDGGPSVKISSRLSGAGAVVGGGVPAPHPHSHRNLRQTLSSSASAGKPFLPEALPHCPVSLVPCSSSQQTPWMPLTFSSWEVASAIPRFSSWWGGAVFSPQTHSPCGNVSSWLPPFFTPSKQMRQHYLEFCCQSCGLSTCFTRIRHMKNIQGFTGS